jgi:hypothetical protein
MQGLPYPDILMCRGSGIKAQAVCININVLPITCSLLNLTELGIKVFLIWRVFTFDENYILYAMVQDYYLVYLYPN